MFCQKFFSADWIQLVSKTALVTGSGGLIGSEAVKHLCESGYRVVGIDNDLRSYFFGAEASTKWNSSRLQKKYYENFLYFQIDIRDYEAVEQIFRQFELSLIIHTAAQPSHDWAAKEPITDFSVNATGTLNLLEMTRKFCPEATFIFTSTNKVYGDNPNNLPLIEGETRWEIDSDHEYWRGIPEDFPLDHTTHSLFGVSKVSADLLTQEYSRYFGLKTAIFRGGCLTGPMHSAAELHGFLAYLVKCIVNKKEYTIFGYKGKQVRDNIHSSDLISMFMEFHNGSIRHGVYNAGGGRENSVSIQEAIKQISLEADTEPIITISQKSRKGDHIWYISDTSKFQSDFPNWKQTYSIQNLVTEMVAAAKRKSNSL